MREMQKVDYHAVHKDYSETIDALECAIAVPRKRAYERKQAATLMQLFADYLEEVTAANAPEAYGYEFRSRDVNEVLDELFGSSSTSDGA